VGVRLPDFKIEERRKLFVMSEPPPLSPPPPPSLSHEPLPVNTPPPPSAALLCAPIWPDSVGKLTPPILDRG
jgi:hypothetical protein